jgi:uncharacterized protein
MGGRFVLRASGDQFSFSLKAAGNHEVILTGERYTAKASALKGIAAILENAGIDERYERRTARDGTAYFVLRAANHQVLGTSETYSSAARRDSGIAAVKAHAASAVIEDETRA